MATTQLLCPLSFTVELRATLVDVRAICVDNENTVVADLKDAALQLASNHFETTPKKFVVLALTRNGSNAKNGASARTFISNGGRLEIRGRDNKTRSIISGMSGMETELHRRITAMAIDLKNQGEKIDNQDEKLKNQGNELSKMQARLAYVSVPICLRNLQEQARENIRKIAIKELPDDWKKVEAAIKEVPKQGNQTNMSWKLFVEQWDKHLTEWKTKCQIPEHVFEAAFDHKKYGGYSGMIHSMKGHHIQEAIDVMDDGPEKNTATMLYNWVRFSNYSPERP